MLNLFRADLFRMARSRSLYIVFAVVLITCLLSAAIRQPGTLGSANSVAMDEMSAYLDDEEIEYSNTMDMINELNRKRSDEQKKNFALEVIGSNMNLYFLIIFIVYGVLASDFSNKCIKNTLSSIANKRGYFAEKLIFISAATLILIFLNTFIFYGMNYVINGEKYSCGLGKAVAATTAQIPLLMGLTAMLTLIVYVVKNGAAYNSIAILGLICFQFVISAISELTKVRCLEIFLREYEVQGALYKLAYSPEKCHTLICCLLGTGLFVISTAAGYKAFKKADIK